MEKKDYDENRAKLYQQLFKLHYDLGILEAGNSKNYLDSDEVRSKKYGELKELSLQFSKLDRVFIESKLELEFNIWTREYSADIELIVNQVRRKQQDINTSSARLESTVTDAEKTVGTLKDVLIQEGSVTLSQEFDKQYRKAENELHVWIMLFLACTAALVTVNWFLLHDITTLSADIVMIKLALIPLSLGALWFIGSQYSKQKLIVEDYIHKKVLTTSLLTFRYELEQNQSERLDSFYRSIFSSLHRSPLELLRNEGKNDSHVLESLVRDFLVKESKTKSGGTESA